MALNLGSMFAWIGADTSGLDKAESRMKKFVSSTNSQMRQVERSSSAMGKVIAGAISFETIRRAGMLADEYKMINARIKNATREFKSYQAVQKEVQRISMDTGGNYGNTASLFMNIQRAAPEIGATQKQVLQLTETLNQLAALSGATGTQMKDGMLQFGQAMASGIMRAEEWNSIMENMPEVGVRIAKGMGMTVGQLRLAVLDGKVLSKDVFASLNKQSAEINAEFKKMPISMSRGFESAKTGAMSFLSQLDEQWGITDKIAQLFTGIGTYLAGDFSESVFNVYSYFADIWEGLKSWYGLIVGIKNVYAELGGDQQTWAQGLDNIRGMAAFMLEAFQKIGPNIKLLWNMTTIWIAEFLIRVKTGIAVIGELAMMLWENVKAWGMDAAAFIYEKFAYLFAKLLSFFGEWFTGNFPDLLKSFGFDELSKEAETFGKAMKTSEEDVKSLAKEVRAGADAQREAADERVHNIERAIEMQERELEAADELKGKYADQYDAEIAGMESARMAREAAHEQKMDQAAKEEKAAVDALNAEKQREASIIAPKAKKVKEPKDRTREKAEAALKQLQESLMSELELEQQHYSESLAALQQAEELKLASIMPYHELRERLEKQHQERLAQFERERLDRQLGDMETFFGNLASLQNAESKKMQAIGKAAAIAEIIVNTARAAMAAYASVAAWGGPFAGMAAAAAVGVYGASQLAAVRGAKATGGGVGMGGMYKVNEQGPELLSVGGEDFLMMGSQGGHVTPNSQLGGGGSGGESQIIVNIYTLPGQTATVEQNGDREVTIRMAVDQTKREITKEAGDGSGTTVPAILKAGGLRRKAS